MNIDLKPGRRSGCVRIPSSKSQMHRLLILAALGTEEVTITCDGFSKDILATEECLNALGAHIRIISETEMCVEPIRNSPEGLCHMYCGESGSTLRFMLPLVGVLGAEAVFHMEGRLPERPLSPLDSALTAHGMDLRKEGSLLYVSGRLSGGSFSLPGNVSSQYISGLLMSLPFADQNSTLTITGEIESAAYIAMTEDILQKSHIDYAKAENIYTIKGNQKSSLTQQCVAEGDYSNAAFFLCMGAFSGQGLTVTGLNPNSLQGDRAVIDVLRSLGAFVQENEKGITVTTRELKGTTIDASPIPDLIPTLSVAACAAKGDTHVINAARLRLKESDRIQSTADLIRALGGEVTVLEDGLIIHGKGGLTGGEVDSQNDHRIAMSAAVAACLCHDRVTVHGAECVQKSYPRFWQDFEQLKGEMK